MVFREDSFSKIIQRRFVGLKLVLQFTIFTEFLPRSNKNLDASPEYIP